VDTTVWSVPITMTCCNKEHRILLEEHSTVHSFSQCDPIKKSWEGLYDSDPHFFYKLNINHTGFYRVAYSSRALKRLGSCINHQLESKNCEERITVNDRIGIVSDLFSLNRSGIICSVDLFNLLTSFKHEKEYL
jgi:hypothetical protein